MENNIQYFEPKRNYIPFIIILGIQVSFVLFMTWALDERPGWSGLIVLSISTGFLFYDYYKTHYRIENGVLYIRSAWFKSSFPVKEIRKIKALSSWLSAPATSNKRLELTYKKYNHIEISPRDVDGFITAVKAENPEVEVSL